jgi:hypothetical protein
VKENRTGGNGAQQRFLESLRWQKVNALKLKPAYNHLCIAAGWSRCDNQPIPGPEQAKDQD